MNLNLKLTINIPKNSCDCHDECVCKNYIKCKNGCFCGNIYKIKQNKSIYAAHTPDYKTNYRISFSMKDKSVSFGSLNIFVFSPKQYYSPVINKKPKYFSPQIKIIKRNKVKTPNSV